MTSIPRQDFARQLALALSALTLAAISLAWSASARADDIDIYSMPNTEGFRPNVLIILDNTANWSASIPTPLCDAAGAMVKTSAPNKEEGTKMGAQKCALYKLISSMSVADLGQFNFALMLFNESPDDSGYPRKAFMQVTSVADKQVLLDLISGLGINKDKGNNASSATAFYEAYRWFTGGSVYLGNKTAGKHDSKAFTDSSKTRYQSPGLGCARNHIIYLANGSPSDNNNSALALLQKLNPKMARFSIPVAEGVSNPDEANWVDEAAAFFNNGADLDSGVEGAQNITTHTIAVTGASSDGNYPNFIRWIAKQGGGLYQQASNSDQIIVAFTKILNQIRASNSVFSSASLPVSANTQGTYLNQVYIGMFRPDGNALPRWVGNLKQFQFLYDAQRDTLQLADANKIPAVSSTTGFIDIDATSFWTKSSSFWINVETASSGKYSRSDMPDGEKVEKGGVAQLLRESYLSSTTARRIYTCKGYSCDNNVDLASAGKDYLFSTTNSELTPAMFGFGSSDTARRDLLINFIRGTDNVDSSSVGNLSVAKDQLGDKPTGATVRPSIHGDVLHSRPIAINYGGTRGVVVFYGTNDGLLRAVNGNQTGLGAGSELWAFVAPEHFNELRRLRENDPEVRYPSTPSTNTTARSRDYFFDGPIGAYQNAMTGEVMIFVGMRRGGRAVYAFNVSDPDRPRLMWRLSRFDSGFGNVGQTWSMPRVAPVKGRSDPVLIMGGGYDNLAEDANPAGMTTMGRGVYVINMRSGERLAWLPTDYSVPADATVIDSDGDGKVDRAYVVDVRAQLYRIDAESATGEAREPSNWVITKIAALNDGAGGLNGTRKVFFAADAVLTRNYTAVLLGTGDREKPLSMTSNDRFYLIKDTKVGKGEPASVTLITDPNLAEVNAGNTAGYDAEGCYFPLATNGEKVINQPITFGGITYFSTNRPLPPSSGSCTRAQNRAYQMPLVCRNPKFNNLVGDGLPPSPVVGYVDVGKGKLVPFVIGGPNDKNSAIEAARANIQIPAKRKRSYWFMENRDR
ncbi:MAG TPA: PilC/PilY family type IV pilus protein [Burkholderiaceae bacterium]|nr:PilC/PilY family type IV pilus protein [Burkholderiaceae bacterium]